MGSCFHEASGACATCRVEMPKPSASELERLQAENQRLRKALEGVVLALNADAYRCPICSHDPLVIESEAADIALDALGAGEDDVFAFSGGKP